MYDPAVTGTIQVDNNTGTFYPYKQGSLIPQWNGPAGTLMLLYAPGANVPVMPAIPFGSIQISSTGTGGLALAASYAALVTFVNSYCFLGGGAVTGTVALSAGEAHIGEVGTSCDVIEITPECLLTPYVSGDVLGTKMTLANAVRISGGTATLTNIEVIDNAQQNAPIDVLIFSQDPTTGTYTNQVAFAWDDTDMLKNVAGISITAGMYTNYGNGSRATTGLLGNVVKASAIAPGTSLWVILVIRGAASYTAINDLTIKLGFYRN